LLHLRPFEGGRAIRAPATDSVLALIKLKACPPEALARLVTERAATPNAMLPVLTAVERRDLAAGRSKNIPGNSKVRWF